MGRGPVPATDCRNNAAARTARCQSLFLCFDEGAEAPKRFIPLRGDLVQITANFSKPLGPQFPDTLAAGAAAAHQSGALKGAQVLRDGLTRDLRTLSQAYDRQRAAIAQSGDYSQPRCIAERGENRRRVS
jgi:hypothetical protein